MPLFATANLMPSLLTDLARLPNGELHDDVAVVVCEATADAMH